MAKAFIIQDTLLDRWEIKVGNGDHEARFCNTRDRARSVAAIMGGCEWWEVIEVEDRVPHSTETDEEVQENDGWNWS